MAKRLQHRGGTTSQHSTFTGAVREVTVDTDKNTLVVHDGATAGGHPLATATNFTSTGIDDNATSTAITIDSSEKVGIGTTTPDDTLHVNSGTQNDVAKFESTDTTASLILVDSATTTDGNRIQTIGDTMNFQTAGSEAMRINSSGNIGIGTNSPDRLLHVKSTGNTRAKIEAGTTSTFGQLYIGTENQWIIGYGSTHSVANALSLKNLNANGTIRFYNNGDNERMRIDSSGNVGIGTSSPADTLNIGAGTKFRTTHTGSVYQQIYSTASGNFIYAYGDNLQLYADSGAISLKTIAAQPMIFQTNNTERMRIDSSGNVGIGTTSPSVRLDTRIATTTGKVVEFHNSGGFGIGFSVEGNGGVNTINSESNQALAFATNGTSNERMRILSNGRVCINTTTSVGAAKLDVAHPGSSEYGITINSTNTSGTQYHLDFRRGGVQAGYITSNSATTVVLNNASDERLKENIQNSNSAIEDLKNIQVRQFDWKDGIDTHRDFGFVAQELVNVVPEAVTRGTDTLDENGKPVQSWGVDYSHIVPRLVKVCQEQQTKIEDLEARITALETNQP